MGWRQMVLGAVVGQVTEFLRERRKAVPSRPAGEQEGPFPPETVEGNIEAERAVGGRLNPLNAAEDMLKRVVDHAQFRTDQTVARAADEVARKTLESMPELVKEIEAAGDRVGDKIIERMSVAMTENVKTMDATLERHREAAQVQVKSLITYALVGVLVVGAALILLAWALR